MAELEVEAKVSSFKKANCLRNNNNNNNKRGTTHKKETDNPTHKINE
jgi:hypothetical protein